MPENHTAGLVFPHQLFLPHPLIREKPKIVLLVEDSLFFGDSRYPMQVHAQRLAFHRASMAAFADKLVREVPNVQHVRYESPESCLPQLLADLIGQGVKRLVIVDVHDFLLRQRLIRAANEQGLSLDWLPTPGFINSPEQNRHYRKGRKRWFMADFYQHQRQRLAILMDGDEPVGGKWSLDAENRRRLPASMKPQLPPLPKVVQREPVRQALCDVKAQFPQAPGGTERLLYPETHSGAERFLDSFLEQRFEWFGAYEDAMVASESWLFHAVLTPMMNTGLLTPEQVVRRALEAAAQNDVPLNSVEGFIRQIIGWREFMRATYEDLGVSMRTGNHWNHTRELPAGFYTAETGIPPIDDALRRILATGYCHHIERLMLIGGFLFLCEVHPDYIYRWFMEMFVDAYDWVMVPNVYAMSQHADGGQITTKPYFSGSNYILKMSDFPRGDWCPLWDALFWRWIIKHEKALSGNPRWAMMCRNAQRMSADKRRDHVRRAETWLAGPGQVQRVPSVSNS